MNDKMNAAILVLDFDGVLHSYKSGWQGADIINDPPVEGAQEFCRAALEYFEIHIVSSRCSQPGGAMAIMGWLRNWDFPPNINVSVDGSKPPAFLTIDDRAITFTGIWPSIQWLNNFKPWYSLREEQIP